MRKYGESLLQIGDAVQALGVTRKMLLNYEDQGLIRPAVRNADSGYRYYSADNLMQIGLIRSLQDMGLSLREIAEYFRDTANIESHLQRLMEKRAALDRNIELLRIRAAQSGDLAVRYVTLPRQHCFCRACPGADTGAALRCLREGYIAAARSGLAPASVGLFALRPVEGAAGAGTLCCVPVESCLDNAACREFPETPAVCIHYRGAYDGLERAIRALLDYTEAQRIGRTGDVRCIYLEGPAVRGADAGDYITQVAVPIAERRRNDRRRR